MGDPTSDPGWSESSYRVLLLDASLVRLVVRRNVLGFVAVPVGVGRRTVAAVCFGGAVGLGERWGDGWYGTGYYVLQCV